MTTLESEAISHDSHAASFSHSLFNSCVIFRMNLVDGLKKNETGRSFDFSILRPSTNALIPSSFDHPIYRFSLPPHTWCKRVMDRLNSGIFYLNRYINFIGAQEIRL